MTTKEKVNCGLGKTFQHSHSSIFKHLMHGYCMCHILLHEITIFCPWDTFCMLLILRINRNYSPT